MKLSTLDGWLNLLSDEFNALYFDELVRFLKSEYETGMCYPPGHLIFNAFDKCQPNQVQVVIFGQDPYINPGQAQGLAFSVPKGTAYPPSLRNIYKEIESDLGRPSRTTGDLTPWAEQGVFLLNATLTVRAGASGSHQGKGWEQFTDRVIERLGQSTRPTVFMLWGSYAQRKAVLIDESLHLVLRAPHPSPLSAHRGFFGCRHFSQANAWLIANKLQSIDW